MKKNKLILITAIGVVIIIFFAAWYFMVVKKVFKKNPEIDQSQCLEYYSTGANYLNYQGTNDTVNAKKLNEDELTNYRSTKQWMIKNKPLAWIALDDQKAVLNGEIFSNLKYSGTGRTQHVDLGNILVKDLTQDGLKIIVKFLLESGVIFSGGEICLTEEKYTNDKYIASYYTIDTYYTKEEVVQDYSLTTTIDLTTGNISTEFLSLSKD